MGYTDLMISSPWPSAVTVSILRNQFKVRLCVWDAIRSLGGGSWRRRRSGVKWSELEERRRTGAHFFLTFSVGPAGLFYFLLSVDNEIWVRIDMDGFLGTEQDVL